MRLAAQAKGGFYPTPPRVVDLIAELIHTPSGAYNRGRDTLRILDPCCGAGEALAQLAQRLDRPNAIPIETYGVELHRDRAQEAEERLGHALASDLFATSIANGAFGLLSQSRRTITTRKTSGRSTPSSPTRPATWPTAACWSSSFPGSASRSRPATCPPTTGGCAAGPSPTRSGRSSTRWS